MPRPFEKTQEQAPRIKGEYQKYVVLSDDGNQKSVLTEDNVVCGYVQEMKNQPHPFFAYRNFPNPARGQFEAEEHALAWVAQGVEIFFNNIEAEIMQPLRPGANGQLIAALAS